MKRFVICCLILGLAPAAGADELAPQTLARELAASLGARYVAARERARAGDRAGAVRAYESLLSELGDAPPARAVRRELAELRQEGAGPGPAASAEPRLHVQVRAELTHGQRRAARAYSWAFSPKASGNEQVIVSAEGRELRLEIRHSADGEIEIEGGLVTPGGHKPLRLARSRLTPGGRIHEKIRLKEGDTAADVEVRANIGTGAAPRIPFPLGATAKRRLKMKIQGAPAREVLSRVAEAGGLRLEIAPDVNADAAADISVEGDDAAQVRAQVCTQLRVTCQVEGGVLKVTR